MWPFLPLMTLYRFCLSRYPSSRGCYDCEFFSLLRRMLATVRSHNRASPFFSLGEATVGFIVGLGAHPSAARSAGRLLQVCGRDSQPWFIISAVILIKCLRLPLTL
jgi:hypothetical protein